MRTLDRPGRLHVVFHSLPFVNALGLSLQMSPSIASLASCRLPWVSAAIMRCCQSAVGLITHLCGILVEWQNISQKFQANGTKVESFTMSLLNFWALSSHIGMRTQRHADNDFWAAFMVLCCVSQIPGQIPMPSCVRRGSSCLEGFVLNCLLPARIAALCTAGRKISSLQGSAAHKL